MFLFEFMGGTFAPAIVLFAMLGVIGLWLLPFAILMAIADARGQTRAFALFALFGWPGFIVGLFALLLSPNRKADALAQTYSKPEPPPSTNRVRF